MPVIGSIKPRDAIELRNKIVATKPGAENIILVEVQNHLDRHGFSSYQQIEDGEREVTLKAPNSIVFLIIGKFKVGEVEITQEGEGHVLEGESTIQLQKYTAITIISI